MRTLIDLPEDDIKWLDRRAAEEGKSRAAMVREAVAALRSSSGVDGIRRYLGIWKDRPNIGDGVEYQRRLRAETSRPWDWDHADVRREYPGLFDDLTGDEGEPTSLAAE